MKMVPWLLPLAFMAVLLLLYIQVTIKASFNSESNTDVLSINVFSRLRLLRGSYHYNREDLLVILPGLKPGKSPEAAQKVYLADARLSMGRRLLRFPSSINSRVHIINRRLHQVARVLKWLTVDKLEWNTRAGSEDAMNTALITGLFWSVKGTVIGVVSSLTRLQKLTINVEPDFARPGVSSYLICILRIRMVHIILIVLALKVRGYLNGSSKRKTEPSH